jgi:tryptophan-rich sensory protein
VIFVFLGLVAVAALFGGQFLPGPWYASLAKPPWNPPNWLFGPVWAVLYGMIAAAGWMVWRAGGGWRGAALPLGLWLVQLVLNAAWSWLFFGMHRMDQALAEITVLWLLILACTLLFWRIRPLAGAMMLPYLAWVGFAAFLNFTIWRLNP